jgi:hypothetical protein
MAKETPKSEGEKIPAWLLSILSTAASMGGSYMLWIKPLEDKLDLLAKELKETKLDLKELELEHNELEKKYRSLKQEKVQNLNGKKEDESEEEELIPIRKTYSPQHYKFRKSISQLK